MSRYIVFSNNLQYTKNKNVTSNIYDKNVHMKFKVKELTGKSSEE